MIRFSTILFCICSGSYPSVVVVPQNISDDSILRIAKNHRQGRFPVAVWRHQRNKAVLLRAGGIERSTISSIMRQTKTVSGSHVASHAISSSASAEQEKYLAAVGKSKGITYSALIVFVFVMKETYVQSVHIIHDQHFQE